MIHIPLGASAYNHSKYELVPIILENWYAQPAPDHDKRGFRLIPTPGLVEVNTSFTGAAGGIFQSDGVMDGEIVVCAGTAVHTLTTSGAKTDLSGSVTRGDLPPQFAASQAPELVMVSDGKAYLIDASTGVTNFTANFTSATGPITSVTVLGNRHLYTEGGSGRVHYSDTGDASTISGFVTAEGDPDEARAVVAANGTAWIFGARVTEAAYLTGDSAVPVAFRPLTVDYGIIASRAVCSTPYGVFFVGNDARIYALNGGRPIPVSTEPIVSVIEQVTAVDKIVLHYYSQADHDWLILETQSGTEYFYDIQNRTWHTRPRIGSVESGIGPVVRVGSDVYCLDNKAGANTALLRLESLVYTNRGDDIRRRATGKVYIEDGEIDVKNIIIEAQSGTALDGSGFGSDPQVWLELARDGHSFENPIQKSLGLFGQYRHRPVFSPMGTVGPGMVAFRVSMSDPVGVVVTGATINSRVVR